MKHDQRILKRGMLAASMKYDGAKLDDIGAALGVGCERARQLVWRGQQDIGDYFKDLNWCAEATASGLLSRSGAAA